MTVRVLIVDDQAPFRSAARMVVELTEGFEVLAEAETGDEAVEKALSLEPDLVLMDVNLPGIDGLEATRRILVSASSIRVVVLSTYEVSEYGPRATEAGAIAFLSKSAFTPEALEDAWGSPALT